MSLKVLLADDSVPAQNMGKKILVDAGYEVLTASNGLEALRKIIEAPPDIAILDIFMPGYTGLEICSRLRSSTPTATLPVILTVGKMEPYRAEDGEQVQSNAVVVKPFAAAELISAVRSLIGEPSPVEVRAEPEAESPLQEPDAALQTDPRHADLPQQSLAAEEPAEFPEPTYGDDLLAAAETSTDASSGRVDEPLPLGDSATEAVEPLSAEPSVYGGADEPLFSGVESSEPESLAYNPDAVRTPFSASVAESLPEFPTADSESPFGEFDLVVEPSPNSPSPGTEILSAEESVEEPVLSMLESDDASGAMAAPGEAPQAETAPAETLVVAETTAPSAPLVPDEEAITPAFEELDNSTWPSPLDELSAPPAEAKSDDIESFTSASVAKHSLDNPLEVEPDSEIEPLAKESQAELIASLPHAPEPDLDRIEELGPISTIGEFYGRGLLGKGESTQAAAESVLEPMEAFESPLDTLQVSAIPNAPAAAIVVGASEVLSESGQPEFEHVPAEAEPLAAVAPPETHEVPEPALAVADAVPEVIAPMEPIEAEAQVAQPLPEIAPVDAEPRIAADSQIVEHESAPVQVEPKASEVAEPTPEPVQAPEMMAEVVDSAMEAHAEKISSTPEPEQQSPSQQSLARQFLDQQSDEEVIRLAVDRVFDRFKRLVVEAILRELKPPE